MKHAPNLGQRTVRPLRVLLLLGNWIGGGAERVAVHLMKALPAYWEVHLGLLHAGTVWLDELDPARVHLAPYGWRRFRYDRPNAELFDPATLAAGAIHGPRAFRAMIVNTRPDVVISFLKGTAILTWLALAGLPQRPRWIAREGNNVLATAREETPGRLVRAISLGLTGAAYRQADMVLTNARAMAGDMAGQFRLDPARLATIPNPVDIAAVRSAAAVPPARLPTRPFLLSAGRLEWQKGHDVLLAAFARSAAAASHDLVILGQGPREQDLRRMAAALGIAEKVHFVGFCANPHGWMARADLFILPSRWEGFPNAAAEAMAAGAPLLLADCAYGPGELLADGRSGTLFPVGDAHALTAAIDRLLACPATRAAHAAAGAERVGHFALPTIMNRYADLIARVAASAPAPQAALRLARA